MSSACQPPPPQQRVFIKYRCIGINYKVFRLLRVNRRTAEIIINVFIIIMPFCSEEIWAAELTRDNSGSCNGGGGAAAAGSRRGTMYRRQEYFYRFGIAMRSTIYDSENLNSILTA